MGTNYYYHTEICPHCQRSNKLHVGKRSGGWTFHFQAYRRSTGSEYDITSINDWSKLFKTTAGILVDEGERVIENPLEFLAKLERPTQEQQKSEDSPERRGSYSPHPDPRNEWRDHEGFAFYDGDFS